ncbi:MAG: RIP metalloprotease RseP [Ruminococcaceae bacterium]|nr:RIP metalloprotease RseP [Oscillospiraceae bacterium]
MQMITFIASIVVFCLLIFIHEFGHFIAAKAVGVTVHEFAIGMGPKIFGFKGKETAYSVRLLPIGGYVKLEGEDEESNSPGALCNKSPIKRFLVLFAGGFMNLLLGFVIFIILMSNAIIPTSEIGVVSENSAFYDAGIKPGDKIIRMEGENYSSDIDSYNDVTYFEYRNKSGKDVKVTFETKEGIITKDITKREEINDKGEKTGRFIYGFSPSVADKGFFNVIRAAVDEFEFMTKLIVVSFVDLFTGNVPADSVAGPVGIVKEIGTAAKSGILSLMGLMAMLSINLGIMNLLPLPALDGGRIFFVLIEIIFRKPVPQDKEAWVHFIGFALLLLLMVLITFNDIRRLIGM